MIFFISEYWHSRSMVVIPGAIFTDSGSVHNDIVLHAWCKTKSVLIELANFIKINQSAPITGKCKVLNACLKSVLLYGQETCDGTSLVKMETLYKKAIRITFGISTLISYRYRQNVHFLRHSCFLTKMIVLIIVDKFLEMSVKIR